MRKVVGLDRKIKRHWLDTALDHLGLERDDVALRSFMNERLQDELPGKESRAKALGIVLRVWSTIPPERMQLRDRAIDLLTHISGHDRIWLHWGMTALAYPFFRDGVEVIGRLLALQDDFTTGHVQDRIVAGWGDRTTCKLAARYLLNTLVDWDILRTTDSQGHFLPANKLKSESTALQLWLLETLLTASESNEIEAQQLLRLPEAFPFAITIGVAELRKSETLAIHRQGLDMDMVGLNQKAAKQEPKPKPRPKKQQTSTKSKDESGKPPKPTAKPKRDTDKAQRRALSSLLRKADSQSLPARVNRFHMFHQTHEKIDGPFAVPIKQCIEMYRDGYFDGCVIISLNLIEQIVQSFGKAKVRKLSVNTFEKSALTLAKKGLINDTLGARLIAAYKEQEIPISAIELNSHARAASEKIACEVLSLLVDLEHARRRNSLFA